MRGSWPGVQVVPRLRGGGSLDYTSSVQSVFFFRDMDFLAPPSPGAGMNTFGAYVPSLTSRPSTALPVYREHWGVRWCRRAQRYRIFRRAHPHRPMHNLTHSPRYRARHSPTHSPQTQTQAQSHTLQDTDPGTTPHTDPGTTPHTPPDTDLSTNPHTEPETDPGTTVATSLHILPRRPSPSHSP